MGVPDHDDPRRLRISDADRHRVADVLRDAASAGRLDLTELEERLEAAYAARTYADLEPITGDLPPDDRLPRPPERSPVPRSAGAVAGRPQQKSMAVMSSCKRQGRWVLPAQHTALAVMGDVLLDLREVTFSSHEVTITATAVMGDVKILIDEFTEVVLDGSPVMGEFKQRRDKVRPQLDRDAPVVHVRGTAMMGNVTVQRLPAPGTPRRFLGTY